MLYYCMLSEVVVEIVVMMGSWWMVYGCDELVWVVVVELGWLI